MIEKIITFTTSIFAPLLAIFLCFAVLEEFWLGWFAADWYQTEMQGMLRSQVITWPWLVFYLVYGSVIFVLAVVANRDKPLHYAGIDGALLGLASYGAYNLTNYSVLEGFTLFITLLDWSWGVFLTSFSAMAGWLGFQAMRKETA